ncbi:type II secretion system protein [Phormidium sp. CLA17]|uniref:pilus assembly FimT family protein n=1 Tax=Leptolyngbya sp. Cla-17 TaxID=2803751 RepID=UPI0014917901|nr:type II secretion system protein [Leptolyngbya sp. Cla-17]MBM0743265.1 type II secretion system protein [Leptolyngbya sp. Cla-17]
MKANRLRTRHKAPIAGFTLLEILVVLIIIGVLFAISAPSWNALMNRQRVGTVREQAVQVIREGQNQARTTRTRLFVVFDGDGVLTPARAAIVPLGNAPLDVSAIKNWRTLGEGEVKLGTIEFSVVNEKILFDNKGAVDREWIGTSAATDGILVVKVKPRGASVETQRCAIVDTLLGAVRLADGTQRYCDS